MSILDRCRDHPWTPGPAVSQRFHVPDLPKSGGLTLRGPEAHHLARVRRIGVGESVTLFDGRGRAVLATVTDVGRDQVQVEIASEVADATASAHPRITLATAVPKGERFDWLVEKATELGVDRLVPLRTEHSVVDPGASKLERLRRHVVEASKQCGRNTFMELAETVPFREFVHSPQEGSIRLLADPRGEPRLPTGSPVPSPEILIAIGPEAGFSKAEVDTAVGAGWLRFRVGTNILRIETAGIAMAAVVMALVESH